LSVIDLVEHPARSATRARVAQRAIGVAAVLLLVLGVAAAAVGEDDPVTDPIELLGAAPDAARDAGTARMTLTTMASGAPGSPDFSATGKGLVDFRTGNVAMTMGFGGSEISISTIDGVLYMRMPDLLHLPTPWIKMSIPAMANGQTQMTPMNSASPTAYLDALAGAGDVSDEGRETIDDAPATHYHVEVDVQRAYEAVPEEQRAELERTFGTVPVTTRSLPMDVWLSDGGLPVRTELRIEVGDLTTTTRMDLTDFGVDVDIQPPPADQVTEVKDMAELANLFPGAAPQ
jgi:hypothetical protein